MNRETANLLPLGNSNSDTYEWESGLERYTGTIFERASGIGVDLKGGQLGAFYLAQPTSLIVGFLIVMFLSFICMMIAIFVDMSGNPWFIGLSLGLPFVVMLFAWGAQYIENGKQDNRFKTMIENNRTAAKSTQVNSN